MITKIVTLLLDADIGALHRSIFLPHDPLVDLCAPSEQGNTALHITAIFCLPLYARLLLCYGADKTIKNKEGLTALDIAIRLQKARVLPWRSAESVTKEFAELVGVLSGTDRSGCVKIL